MIVHVGSAFTEWLALSQFLVHFSPIIELLLVMEWICQTGILFFSVTQRANHARDYLLEEGLEKIDG